MMMLRVWVSSLSFSLLITDFDLVVFSQKKKKAAKGMFIGDNGLKGFAMWEVAGDEHDILLDAISQALDIQSVCS
jgi:chitinase